MKSSQHSQKTKMTKKSKRIKPSPLPQAGTGSGPYLNQAAVPGLFNPQAGAGAPPSGGNPAGNIFGLFDRFGGIDGIMSSVGKFQKMIGMFQQFQQVFKLLGSFGPLAGTKAFTQGLPKKPVRNRTRPSGKRGFQKKQKPNG